MDPSDLDQRGGQGFIGAIRARERRPRMIMNGAGETLLQDSPQLLVARVSADAVELAELVEAEDPTLEVLPESKSLVHGCCLRPRHRSLPPATDPVSECHPCSRSKVSPMYPVCTYD